MPVPCPLRPGEPCGTVQSPNTKLGAAGFSCGAAAGAAAAAVAPGLCGAELSKRLEFGGDMLCVLSVRLRLKAGADASAAVSCGRPVPPPEPRGLAADGCGTAVWPLAAAGVNPSVRPESCVSSADDHAAGLAAAGDGACCVAAGVPATGSAAAEELPIEPAANLN